MLLYFETSFFFLDNAPVIVIFVLKLYESFPNGVALTVCLTFCLYKSADFKRYNLFSLLSISNTEGSQYVFSFCVYVRLCLCMYQHWYHFLYIYINIRSCTTKPKSTQMRRFCKRVSCGSGQGFSERGSRYEVCYVMFFASLLCLLLRFVMLSSLFFFVLFLPLVLCSLFIYFCYCFCCCCS